jgi:hypothetical protein
MHFTLAGLERLFRIYFIFRPILSALLFTLLIVVLSAAGTTLAQPTTFTIQLAARDAQPEAESIAEQFRTRGVQAVVTAVAMPERRQLYRVRAGRFGTVAAARNAAEQWRAAGWLTSYWVAREVVREATELRAEAAATPREATRSRIVGKALPDLGLGELLTALADRWTVRVPNHLGAYAASFVFPKTGQIRPAVVLLDEARLRQLTPPFAKHRDLLNPLEMRLEPGIKNSPAAEGMKYAQSEKLIASLRSISGFQELAFDDRGYLVLGQRVAGGSELARVLLRAAVESNESFEIESLDGSDTVVFGAFLSAAFNHSEHGRVEVNRIQLDFQDFAELRGDPRLLEAFDPGFVFLHELAHGVWDLADDEHAGLGECEAFINQIRRQLGLPERLRYHFKVRSLAGGGELGELLFTQPKDDTRPKQTLKLRWDNRTVNSNVKPTTPDATIQPPK